jgi:hypothetical protein
MAGQKTLKKGSYRVATAHKPNFHEVDDDQDKELGNEVNGFVRRVHSTLQEARSKMSKEEAAKADEQAKAIFARATSAAKSSRHSS